MVMNACLSLHHHFTTSICKWTLPFFVSYIQDYFKYFASLDLLSKILDALKSVLYIPNFYNNSYFPTYLDIAFIVLIKNFISPLKQKVLFKTVLFLNHIIVAFHFPMNCKIQIFIYVFLPEFYL